MKSYSTFSAVLLVAALLLAGPGFGATGPMDGVRPAKKTPASASCCGPVGKTASTVKVLQPAVASPAPVQTAASIVEPVAQLQTVLLTGVVLLPDGRPCAGACVFPAFNPRQLVVTDAQGAFSLVVPAGQPVSLKVDLASEGSSYVKLSAPSAEPLRITLGQ